MPSAKRVAWAQLKVGIVVVVAMALVGILVVLITSGGPGLFAERATLYTYLSDSAAMTTGSAVRLNGIPIGEVSDIGFSGENDPRRIIKVTMDVDAGSLQQIPVDSQVAIAAENVLGSKFLNIRKGTSTDHVQAGATIPSLDTSDFDDVVASGYALLTSLQGMLKRIDGIVTVIESGEGSIGKLINDPTLYDNLNRTAAGAAQFTENLNSHEGTLGRILHDPALYDDIRGTMARVNGLLDGLEAGQGTAGKLLKDQALYDDLRATLNEFRTMAANLNAGQGTAGRLLKDDALYTQLQSAIAKMDTLLNNVNTGQGTLGQLAVNPQMYESLNGATRQMNEFLQEFRANPKKFLTLKLQLF